MALAVDASSPIRWTGTPGTGVDIVSASFTPPAGSFVVVCNSADTGASNGITLAVSGGGLTWAQQAIRDFATGGLSGHASIWTAAVAASAAMTIGVQRSVGGGGTNRISAKAYVVTGQHSSPVGSTGTGSTTINDTSPVLFTPAGDNSLEFLAMCDWAVLGAPASSDGTEDSQNYAGGISVMSAYKALGLAGAAATMNIDCGGTTDTARVNWAAIEIKLPPASVEQEGFRFYTDAASPVALASQDTAITQPADTNTLLRALINATNDPLAAQHQLEYRVNVGRWRVVKP